MGRGNTSLLKRNLLKLMGRTTLRGVAFILVTIGLGWVNCVNAERVGMREVTIANPERETSVLALVWYPTAADESPALIGDNAVFRGTPAQRDAPVADGRFPLIVIAHGGFRSSPNSANWLASVLASKGYIVAVVIPPKIPIGPVSQAILSEFWLRPSDLSFTITTIAADAIFGSRTAIDQVGAVGFFLGGYSTLALTGARVDTNAFMTLCQGEQRGFDCDWFEKGGVNVQQVDVDQLGQSHLDQRLKVAVVVDPEWTHLLTSSSLGSVDVPVHIINVGSWGETNSPLNASTIAANIPRARYTTISQAGKYSAFAECKPKGGAILQEEGDDASLCDDGPENLARAEIHKRLISTLTDALRQSLRP